MVKNKASSRVHMKSTKPGHRNINCYRALPKDPSEFHKTVLISIILKTGFSSAGVNNKCLGPIFTLFVAVQIALLRKTGNILLRSLQDTAAVIAPVLLERNEKAKPIKS